MAALCGPEFLVDDRVAATDATASTSVEIRMSLPGGSDLGVVGDGIGAEGLASRVWRSAIATLSRRRWSMIHFSFAPPIEALVASPALSECPEQGEGSSVAPLALRSTIRQTRRPSVCPRP